MTLTDDMRQAGLVGSKASSSSSFPFFKSCRLPRAFAAALAISILSIGSTQGQVRIPDEYDKTVRASQAVGALGSDLFGDQTSLYTGATSFSITDVSLPGNNALPVAVGRRFEVKSRDGFERSAILNTDGMFADWDLEIPHLSGTFASSTGWQVDDYSAPNNRCSGQGLGEPPIVEGTFYGLWYPSEYWSGYTFHQPGGGDQEMLVFGSLGNPNYPTDGNTYRWVTNDQWYFSCLPNTANGVPGEGFLAHAPDGTRYWFNWIVSRFGTTIVKEKGAASALRGASNQLAVPMAPVGSKTSLTRAEVWILPTRVEDRFGNFVTYTYDAAKPWRLMAIAGSDGRQLSLAYNASGDIASVSDGSRNWTYTYSTYLTKVALPDNSAWLINFNGLLQAYTTPYFGSADTQFCERAGASTVQDIYTGTMTHPSGAVGEFKVQSKVHGLSYVPKICRAPGAPQSLANYAVNPFLFDVVGLIQKTVTGPGLPSRQWIYSYGPPNNSWLANCPNNSCVSTKTVEVIGPSDFVRYTFGNKYRENVGKLMKVESGESSNSIRRTVATAYQLDPNGRPYPAKVGSSPFDRGDHMSEKLLPVLQETVIQDGRAFSRTAQQFDQFARPTQVTKSSAPSP